MNDEQMQPLLEVWLRDREIPRPKVQTGVVKVMANVPRTRQQGRWWPLPAFDRPPSAFPSRELAPVPIPATNGRQPARGFTMFSALKFVAAGVIVALFGGFLLTGILTTPQGDEVLPAATTDELLPGVTLTVEEVEPGIYRVLDDGVRDLAKANNFDIVAGHDGGVWLLRNRWFFPLGGEGHGWATEKPEVGDFEVAPDGTVWTQAGTLQSFDGERWTTHMEGGNVGAVEVTPDGIVWAMWQDPERERRVFGYLDDDGWQVLSDDAFVESLHVASRDDIWAFGYASIGGGNVVRFVDGLWQPVSVEGATPVMGLGPDGTFWGRFLRASDVDEDALYVDLVRFDGSEWSRWPDALGDTPASSTPLRVAPDGSVWYSRWRQGADRCAGGVAHFDGVTRDRYLPTGPCVEAIDITADGSVWVLDEEGGLYVITPEAVAATE